MVLLPPREGFDIFVSQRDSTLFVVDEEAYINFDSNVGSIRGQSAVIMAIYAMSRVLYGSI